MIGNTTGRRYPIRVGTSTNITELDSLDGSVARWCFVPRESLPAGNVMLAQKIALETMRSPRSQSPAFPPYFCNRVFHGASDLQRSET